MTTRRVHLGKDSPFLNRHHQNWRLKTMLHLDTNSETSLHYSAVIGIDQDAVVKIREILIKALEKKQQILKECGEEVLYGFCADFFPV